jgi:hypothetical protein
MPYMQRITWSGVALHAGVLPGYPASHGCIRLTYPFATELWRITKLNARVVVTPEDLHPVEFAHALLPTPTLTPSPPSLSDTAPGPSAPGAFVSLAREAAATDNARDSADAGLLNPLERAKAEKARLIADAAAKGKAAKAALANSAAKAADGNHAIAALREAELATAAAHRQLEVAADAADNAKTPEAVERARAARMTAEAKVDETGKAAEEARRLEAEATSTAFAAARAAWEAERASELASAASKAAEKSTEPISIFISKKTGRLYVRQGWMAVHEAEVTFRQPDAPLGTPLFLAMETQPGGKAMRWLSVSMPSSPQREPREGSSRRGSHPSRGSAPSASRVRDTPASALERVEMGEESKAFIADRLWAGASLIISDQGISEETGAYTDFIVLTR